MSPLRALPALHRSQLLQAVRVTIATALTYAIYRWLDLPQGYWAVFTVVIVMQGSIASTLGAAADRLAGTIAGALIGGAATIAIHHGDVSTGTALIPVIGLTALAAAVRPQLKNAPITAAIMLLTQPAGMTTEAFVLHRVLEIALGGFIGVATSVLVFPARSHALVVDRAATALADVQRLLRLLAGGIEKGEPILLADEHARLRSAMGGVEQASRDAERERASGLTHGIGPPPIVRALWRVRNDLVLIGRALDHPLPGVVIEPIAAPAAALLRAEADYVGRCIDALKRDTSAPRGDEIAVYDAFEHAFGGIREAGLIRSLNFADAGRIFGLAFAMEVLHRDLTDLGSRFGP